jgi:hypothetical protein
MVRRDLSLVRHRACGVRFQRAKRQALDFHKRLPFGMLEAYPTALRARREAYLTDSVG